LLISRRLFAQLGVTAPEIVNFSVTSITLTDSTVTDNTTMQYFKIGLLGFVALFK
jgi:hypothetical protein